MSEGIVNNNPKKELLYALGGIALFLGIVLLIGISAFLRPAGEHITATPTEASEAADEAEVVATEDTATEADTDVATAEATAPDAAADATVTPAPDAADSAVVTAEAGTATASGTVSQAAVADTDLTAEQADGDLDAGNAGDTGNAADETAAQ